MRGALKLHTEIELEATERKIEVHDIDSSLTPPLPRPSRLPCTSTGGWCSAAGWRSGSARHTGHRQLREEGAERHRRVGAEGRRVAHLVQVRQADEQGRRVLAVHR